MDLLRWCRSAPGIIDQRTRRCRPPDDDRDGPETASVSTTDRNFRDFFVRYAGPAEVNCARPTEVAFGRCSRLWPVPTRVRFRPSPEHIDANWRLGMGAFAPGPQLRRNREQDLELVKSH